ncbi:hypothetical protein A2U01_0019288, partial [Trifolium medium]|nr:hypothetical protein [Trifolium medium]
PNSPPREHNTVISPGVNNQEQLPVDNTGDPRDGRKTSLSSDEDGEDVQILMERQLEKRPQITQEKTVDKTQSPAPLTRADITDLLAALRSTNETLHQHGLRITALEESIRSKRSGSRSPRRARPRSKTPPPRSQDTHNRRPALEQLQPPSKKHDRTPPREDMVSPTTKKGKTIERSEQRRRSPQGLALMAKQGTSSSRNRGNHRHRSPTPPQHDNSPPQYSPEGSDEEPYHCSISLDIMRDIFLRGLRSLPLLELMMDKLTPTTTSTTSMPSSTSTGSAGPSGADSSPPH